MTAFSQARRSAIAAAEAAGHQKITPRDPSATPEEIGAWVRMRYAAAAINQDAALAEALRVYAVELGVQLPEVPRR